MSDASGTRQVFGEGPLSRVAAFIYTLLVVEFLLLVTSVPGLVPLVLLGSDASNIPLAALCALPLGPALSAALFAMRNRSQDLADLKPMAAFWRGYKLNVWGSLQVWIPWLVLMVIVTMGLANFTSAGVPTWWAVLLIVVAVAVTLCTANALVIVSLFAFRARDVARLSIYFIARTPLVTLGVLGLLIIAVAVTVFLSEAVLALFGSILAAVLLRTCQPMIAEVKERFVA